MVEELIKHVLNAGIALDDFLPSFDGIACEINIAATESDENRFRKACDTYVRNCLVGIFLFKPGLRDQIVQVERECGLYIDFYSTSMVECSSDETIEECEIESDDEDCIINRISESKSEIRPNISISLNNSPKKRRRYLEETLSIVPNSFSVKKMAIQLAAINPTHYVVRSKA